MQQDSVNNFTLKVPELIWTFPLMSSSQASRVQGPHKLTWPSRARVLDVICRGHCRGLENLTSTDQC